MKKLFFLAMLAVTISAHAQTFDETQLIGTWQPTTINGTLPYGIPSFGNIALGDMFRGIDDDFDPVGTQCSGMIYDFVYPSPLLQKEEDPNLYILDFFISNGNKLHIICGDDFAMRFVIEELTANSLRLKTYDGKCNIAFTKVADPAGIRGVEVDAQANNDAARYNLAGQRVDSTYKGISIHSGKKQVVK